MPKRHEVNNRLPLFLAVPPMSIRDEQEKSKWTANGQQMKSPLIFFIGGKGDESKQKNGIETVCIIPRYHLQCNHFLT